MTTMLPPASLRSSAAAALSDSVACVKTITPEANNLISPCMRCDFSADSDVLLISFAGNAADMLGTTLFEFVKLTADIPVKKVFLRDPDNLWFQKGIPGIGNSVEAVCRFLQNVRKDNGIKRVVVIGNSAGGYAALLFGILIGADEIHAFGPQSRLLTSADSVTPQRVQQVLLLPTGPDSDFLDLRKVAEKKMQKHTMAFVHFDPKEVRDNRHARHMAEVSGFYLVPHPVGGHAIATVLKQTGALKRLLEESLVGSTRISKARVFFRTLEVYPTWLGKGVLRRVLAGQPRRSPSTGAAGAAAAGGN